MKKYYIWLLAILFIGLVIGGFWLQKDKENIDTKKEENEKEDVVEVVEADGAKTLTYNDGDVIYVPTEETIAYDSDADLLFYEDLLNVFLVSEISDEEAENLARMVDGHIVGKIQGVVNILQLQVTGDSIASLSKLAGELGQNELVKYAKQSVPLFVSDAKGEKKRTCLMDESEPVNADDLMESRWWEEAVYAQDAWEYIGNKGEKFKPVTVAVLEIGELNKVMKEIASSLVPGENHVCEDGEDCYSNHAELVTKLIVSDHDSDETRGIANGIAKVDFYSIGGNPDVKAIKEIIKPIMDNEKVVVNNSWGPVPYSKKGFNEMKFKFENIRYNLFKSYDKYLAEEVERRDAFSVDLIGVLDELIKNKKHEFLLVQAAGNGLYRAKGETFEAEVHANKAEMFGYFSNINESTYTLAEKQMKKSENGLTMSLNEMKEHILVVGGSDPKQEGYQLANWSGYGDMVDIVAPGNYFPLDGHCDFGTSFAAPIVSGVAALAWSYNQKLTAPDVKKLLLHSSVEYVMPAKSAKGDNRQYYPSVNAMAFLNENPYYHYEDLKRTFRTAIEEQWDQEKLDEQELGPYAYVPSTLPSNYGYMYKDLNGDGIEEMIVGYDFGEETTLITEIYTIVDEEPFKFFTSGIRHRADIYSDGTIVESAITSPGRGEELYEVYDVTPNGKKDIKAGYVYDATDDIYEGLVSPDEDMIEAEAEELWEEYKEPIDLSFTPFILDETDDEK